MSTNKQNFILKILLVVSLIELTAILLRTDWANWSATKPNSVPVLAPKNPDSSSVLISKDHFGKATTANLKSQEKRAVPAGSFDWISDSIAIVERNLTTVNDTIQQLVRAGLVPVAQYNLLRERRNGLEVLMNQLLKTQRELINKKEDGGKSLGVASMETRGVLVKEESTTVLDNAHSIDTAGSPRINIPRITDSYFLLSFSDGRKYMRRSHSELLSSTSLDGRNVWVIKTSSVDSGQSSRTRSEIFNWVDQDKGILLKYEDKIIYDAPVKCNIQGEAFSAVESNSLRTYFPTRGKMDQISTYVEASGKLHSTTASYDANYTIFRIPRGLKVGDYYPWKTTAYNHQVTEEKMITVPGGDFSCIVVKQILAENWQYNLEYFDEQTGMLVKSESFTKPSQGEWKLLYDMVLLSQRFSN